MTATIEVTDSMTLLIRSDAIVKVLILSRPAAIFHTFVLNLILAIPALQAQGPMGGAGVRREEVVDLVT